MVPRLLQFDPDLPLDPFKHLKAGKVSKVDAGSYEVHRRPRKGEKKNASFEETAAATQCERSTVGAIAGVPNSRGFLNSSTEQSRRQEETLDDELLEVYKAGRAKQLEIARQRQALDVPFETPDPPGWKSTSHAAHVNLLPAADYSARETALVKPRGRKKMNGDAAPTLTQTTFNDEYARRNEAMKDIDALQAYQRETVQSMQRRTAKKPAWVGGPPTTTYREKLAAFDVKQCEAQMDGTCREPVLHKSQQIRPEDEEEYHRRQERAARKYEGDFATLVSESFTDKSGEAEKATHVRNHFFDVRNGTLQMPVRGNEPLRKPTNFQQTSNTSNINPMQFTTAKDLYERTALSGLVA